MSKRKLLLADDSITIQKVVNLTFADEGFEVISVGDGNSAMDKLREDAPDLVLADVNMPGLNGYEICEKIKESGSNIPVILLVGSFEPFDEDEAKRVGADDFLTKPFQSISELVSKVTELMSYEKQNVSDTETFNDSEDMQFGSFEDAAVDDEMIQTDQIGSLPVNETTKFETRINKNKDSAEFAKMPDEYGVVEESFQSLNEDREQEEDFAENQEFETEAAKDEGEGGFWRIEKDKKTEFPIPEAASVLELDEMNLLELPPLDIPEKKFEEIDLNNLPRHFAADSSGNVSDSADEEIVSPYTSTKAVEMPEYSNKDEEFSKHWTAFDESEEEENLTEKISPEMVKLLTQKVIAGLSDKVIEEIAWEVVPQMADLIMKKIAEEKTKN